MPFEKKLVKGLKEIKVSGESAMEKKVKGIVLKKELEIDIAII